MIYNKHIGCKNLICFIIGPMLVVLFIWLHNINGRDDINRV